MTLNEWLQAQALIGSLWPHARRLDPKDVRVQHELVSSLSLEEVLGAIRAHSQTGADFPPTPGQVLRRCAQSTIGNAVDAGAAIALIRKAAGRFGRNQEGPALEWLTARSVHVAHWVIEHGWRELCNERIDDAQFGGAVQARLERAYTAVASAVDRDVAQNQLQPLVERRLAALTDTGAHKPAGLRRMDVAGLLPNAQEAL